VAKQQPRTNDQWLQDLDEPGPRQDQALTDLRQILVRGLGYAMAKYSKVTESDLQDFAQDALLKVLAGLKTFRGQSRFTTWAQKIAVHTAFTELRRRRWRDVSLEAVTGPPEGKDAKPLFIPSALVDPSTSTEQHAMQSEILDVMRGVIEHELTDKQRQAMVAVRFQGMPIEEVAQRMDTNPNALYKLLFDARKRLKERMLAKGLSSEDILSAFDL
jgi:RNA polymerase sigma-70 factor (ECF subfamily)